MKCKSINYENFIDRNVMYFGLEIQLPFIKNFEIKYLAIDKDGGLYGYYNKPKYYENLNEFYADDFIQIGCVLYEGDCRDSIWQIG